MAFSSKYTNGDLIMVGALEDTDPVHANPSNDLARALYFDDPRLNKGLPAYFVVNHGSNYGDIDIWAPGDNMYSIGPAEISGTPPDIIVKSPDLIDNGGTSAAAPIISGIVALLKSKNSHFTKGDVLKILRDSSFVRNVTDNETRTASLFDPILRGNPLGLQSQCGVIQTDYFNKGHYEPFGISCGQPNPTSYTMNIANANQAMIKAGFSKSGTLNGTLRDNGGTLALDYNGASYLLSWGNITDAQVLKRMLAQDNGPNPAPIASLIGKNVEVRGDVVTSSGVRKINFQTMALQTGFSILAASPPVAAAPKTDKWLVKDSKGLKVNPDQYLGIAIDGRDLHGIQVLIDGQYQSLKEIADNYVILNQMPNLTPGLKDVILKFAGGEAVTLEKALEIISLPRMQEVQSIPTSAAARFASFRIGADTFLAVTNSYEQSPPRYDLTTELYRWDGHQFAPFQSIPTNGAFAVEPFTLGNDHFLAIAEYTAEGVFEVNSHILKWDGTHFAPFQAILTHGANGWKHFEMNGEHYLIVANHATGSGGYVVNVQTDSVLYKWNGNQFVAVQNLPTTAARDWEYLEVGQEKFLAVANEYDGISYDTSTQIFSEIFKWDGSQFNSFQKIHSEGARDWKAFALGDRHFLALANLWGSTHSPVTAEKAAVYEYVNGRFEVAQTFDSAVLSWDHIQREGRDYLLAAADARGTQMYLWNGTQWQLHQAITTDLAYDGLFFPIGDQDYYVSVSVYYANGSYHANSKVYKFE